MYALPPKFGEIAKAYIVQDEQLNLPTMQKEVKANLFMDERNLDQLKAQDAGSSNRLPNPNALNLYTLGYTANKKLTTPNNDSHSDNRRRKFKNIPFTI